VRNDPEEDEMGDPVLMCAVCQRPVDRWEAIEEPWTMVRTFVAYCHGEKDTCRIPMRYLSDMQNAIRSGQKVEAVAFARAALAHSADA
jgi:hypothetical protein